ncbi:MAG: hypothetical protein JSS43_07040 [Proteobacteria bacterium]|nr:hypothetical protein [Pseudomonadota bacterium]
MATGKAGGSATSFYRLNKLNPAERDGQRMMLMVKAVESRLSKGRSVNASVITVRHYFKVVSKSGPSAWEETQ